jgi:hypothetical protein
MAALPQNPVSPNETRPNETRPNEAGANKAGNARSTVLADEKLRQKITADIPWWYSPWGHLAATTGIGLAVLGVSSVQLVRLGTTRATDWLMVPMVLLLANFFEWRVHKKVLHRRNKYFPPMQTIYDKHTPMHHMVYVEEDMALRSTKEFRLVLIPAAGVAGIVLTASPIAFAVGRLWSAPAGWLLHLCYHAPSESFIGRLAFIKVMRAHHAKHHDPRFMQKWNFNVTLPLFDWVMGTIAPKTKG